MIDTHCHLDLAAFDDDREAVWQRARERGVRAVIVPAVEPATWPRTAAVARAGERFVAFGIHPQVLGELDDATLDVALATLADTCRAHRDVTVAIGECGLDGQKDLARQQRVLAAHVAVACELDLPLLLHVFHAHDAALPFLRTLRLPPRPGVIHSYSGGPALVPAYLALGFHVSFAGAVTRPAARRPVEAARLVPAGRLLIETDGPDQRPSGAPEHATHPRRCDPSDLVYTAVHLAHARGESVEHLVAHTSEAAQALFRLPGA